MPTLACLPGGGGMKAAVTHHNASPLSKAWLALIASIRLHAHSRSPTACGRGGVEAAKW